MGKDDEDDDVFVVYVVLAVGCFEEFEFPWACDEWPLYWFDVLGCGGAGAGHGTGGFVSTEFKLKLTKSWTLFMKPVNLSLK